MTSSKSKPKVPTFKYHYTGGYDCLWILESHKYNTWVRIPAIYYVALANYYSLSNSVSSAVKMGLASLTSLECGELWNTHMRNGRLTHFSFSFWLEPCSLLTQHITYSANFPHSRTSLSVLGPLHQGLWMGEIQSVCQRPPAKALRNVPAVEQSWTY